ncbi:MAG: peptide/nickel transport system permease protein [Maribacter sp.]|jgi:peptide/nickel transport system permease protein
MFGKKKSKEVTPGELDQSYGAYVKRQFKKNKRALYSFYVVMFLASIAIFADFIANDKPLVCSYQGSTHFPVFKSYAVDMGMATWHKDFRNQDFYDIELDWAIWPPVPYLNTTLDNKNSRFVSPFEEQKVESFRWRHHMGTNKVGNDVLSCMVHGTRVAFLVGIVSMSIAFFIGVFVGGLAGFYGDDQMKMSRARVLMNILTLPIAFFYGFFVRSYTIGDASASGFGAMLLQLFISFILFIVVMGVGNLLASLLKFIPILKKRISIPLDLIITRIIEVIVSVPVLILILAMVAIIKPSIFMVMVIIGCVGWTGIARFVRAELLRVRNLEYIEAAHALGFPKLRTMLKHAIPNSLAPVFISVAFGIAAAILTESFLSFLGFGIPKELNTWGQLLTQSRGAAEAWWLAIFPGFAIFATVTLFNLIGEGLTDAIDPRLKQ